ncbi:MAG: hypothetical protein IH856_24640 [Deltaproteobacteria bacterium]|nr:hypothetical protein [Deltaproteobacteria bacterium]
MAEVWIELGDEKDKRFEGAWRIEEMEVWGDDSLNLLGPANITFDDDRLGSFQFVAVVGFIDCQFSERDGKPLVEFSWQGHDDSDDACGRGWAIIEGDGKLRGRIFIHCADDSAFTAKRD